MVNKVALEHKVVWEHKDAWVLKEDLVNKVSLANKDGLVNKVDKDLADLDCVHKLQLQWVHKDPNFVLPTIPTLLQQMQIHAMPMLCAK